MTHTPAQRIGANVRAEMARVGISQMKLAETLGMSQTAVSARLRGKTAFDVDELTRVAEVLKVDATTLLADQRHSAAS